MTWTQDNVGIDTSLEQDVTITGSLVTDNIKIDGNTIGHTTDVDLLTLTSGTLTITGNLTATNHINTVAGTIQTTTGKVRTASMVLDDDKIGYDTKTDLITLTTGGITVDGTITGDTITGTLTTPAQPNITSLGIISSLIASGTTTLQGLDLQGNISTSTVAVDWAIKENDIAALEIKESGGSSLLIFDTVTPKLHIHSAADVHGAFDVDGACSATSLQVDNININGNTISSTDTDGDITLTPNGSGVVNLGSLECGPISSGVSISSFSQGIDTHNIAPSGNKLSLSANEVTINGSWNIYSYKKMDNDSSYTKLQLQFIDDDVGSTPGTGVNGFSEVKVFDADGGIQKHFYIKIVSGVCTVVDIMNNMVLAASTGFSNTGTNIAKIETTIGPSSDTYYATTNGGNLMLHAITMSS